MSDAPGDVIAAGQRDLAAALRQDLGDIINYKYDVFIIYATSDEHIAIQVCEGLELQNLRCIAQFKQEAFITGHNVVDNIVYYVKQSKRTLLLLTKNSLKNNWVTLETILALEESQSCNTLRLRMLVDDVSELELGKFKNCGLVASVPHCRLDFNKKDWHVDLKDQINVELPLPDVLPVGCMAHGLVFSHFTGFLSYVLPVLKDEIEKSDICREKPDQVSRKYYMLLPGSGKIHHDLTCENKETGIKITFQETVKFQRQHVDKMREFNITIYKITKGKKEFYFFADFPTVLNAMFTMVDKKLAKVDIRFQIARFYYTINEMINHAENQSCHNTVQLILFNEDVVSMAEELWNAVSESVPEERKEKKQQHQNPPQPIERLMSLHNITPGLDATICCYDECDNDKEIALSIQKFLQDHGKNVIMNQPGQSQFQLEDAKWFIFILSKEALTNCKSLSFQCHGALVQSMNSGEEDGCTDIRVLVVIVDIEPREVPRSIRCVNMLKAEEPDFCRQILQSMNGEPLKMEHKLPCGDVATGLAWALVINYLKITLLTPSAEDTGRLDYRGRIKQFLQEKEISVGCIPKMFIILPKSCKTSNDVVAEANKGCAGQEKVEKLGELLPVFQNTGGQRNRAFNLNMFMHTELETQRILIGLRYLAKGDFFSEVGDLHGVSKSTVSLVLNNFLDAVNENLNNIRFPMTRREQEKNRVEFYRKCGIPGVLGAIDGTLIPIIAPTHQEEAYRCRKGFHALNVQAVTDCNLKFIDLVAKWPGSQHDSAIFNSCGLKRVCFITEYLASANCMRQMVDVHKFAGLQEDEMGRQCEDFARILPDIIDRKAVKEHLGDISNMVELIVYDDKKESLMSAIKRHIQAGTQDMVFAKDRDQSVRQDFHLL